MQMQMQQIELQYASMSDESLDHARRELRALLQQAGTQGLQQLLEVTGTPLEGLYTDDRAIDALTERHGTDGAFTGVPTPNDPGRVQIVWVNFGRDVRDGRPNWEAEGIFLYGILRMVGYVTETADSDAACRAALDRLVSQALEECPGIHGFLEARGFDVAEFAGELLDEGLDELGGPFSRERLLAFQVRTDQLAAAYDAGFSDALAESDDPIAPLPTYSSYAPPPWGEEE